MEIVVLNPYKERLAQVESQIARACAQAGRKRNEITLVAVSKTQPAEAVEQLAKLGQVDFGENYVQEAVDKVIVLRPQYNNLRWHFIGKLQSNKAKQLVGNFALIQSLDRLDLAQKLNKVAAEKNYRQACLLEINLDGESSKGGIVATELCQLLQNLSQLENLQIKGLMCIPAPETSAKNPRKAFAELREFLEMANKSAAYPTPLTELSMGMSSDFEAAILEGATIIRVGTALFGARAKK